MLPTHGASIHPVSLSQHDPKELLYHPTYNDDEKRKKTMSCSFAPVEFWLWHHEGRLVDDGAEQKFRFQISQPASTLLSKVSCTTQWGKLMAKLSMKWEKARTILMTPHTDICFVRCTVHKCIAEFSPHADFYLRALSIYPRTVLLFLLHDVYHKPGRLISWFKPKTCKYWLINLCYSQTPINRSRCCGTHTHRQTHTSRTCLFWLFYNVSREYFFRNKASQWDW